MEGTELGPRTIKLKRSQCSARGLAGSRWLVVTVYHGERVGEWGTEPPPKGDVQEKMGVGKRRKPCSDPGLCEKEHDREWSPPVHQASGHQEPSEKWLERQTAQLSCLLMSTGPKSSRRVQTCRLHGQNLAERGECRW